MAAGSGQRSTTGYRLIEFRYLSSVSELAGSTPPGPGTPQPRGMRDARRDPGIDALPGYDARTIGLVSSSRSTKIGELGRRRNPGSTFEAIIAAAAARTLELLGTRLEQEAWPAWMSVETASRYLDVSPERLRKLQARREIPFHQEAPGCRVFFRRHDLDEWMAAFRLPTRTAAKR